MAKAEGKILVVDDDKTILESLKFLLKYDFEMVTIVGNPNRLPDMVKNKDHDVILLDMNFQAGIQTGNEGIFWLKKILETDPDAVIVMMTAYGDIELAVKAIKIGATDFVQKPWNSDKLISTLKAAYQLRITKKKVETLKYKNELLKEESNRPFDVLLGKSNGMKKVFEAIEKVAKTDANILILGENGTGKELVARKLHNLSKRSEEIFATVDMASLSESLFEAELFGYNKGSFTDAKTDRMGRFENASGGSLFLDEIGNLSLSMQSKILTVLQNKEIFRIGSNKAIPINIRLISATNKDLYKMIDDELFREDLLYRINTIQIEIPPLRERKDDIPLLTDHFLNLYKTKYEKPLLKINAGSLDALNHYYWPGNVRELQHTIEKAVIMCDGDVLRSEDFYFRTGESSEEPNKEIINLEVLEKITIGKALRKHNGIYSKAAKDLGISRPTLYKKIKNYGL